jgi:MFS family permease
MPLKDHFIPWSLGIRGLSGTFVLVDRLVVPSAQLDRNPFWWGASNMSVTTGSLGTAHVPASNPSLQGLDRVNFFLAAMLAGFGPYIAGYLANQSWSQAEIGLVLSAGSVAALLSQLPGGELLDKVRSKRAVIAVGVGIVIVSALILAFWPRLPFVFMGLVLQGVTGGFLGPAIAAISLGLVGRRWLNDSGAISVLPLPAPWSAPHYGHHRVPTILSIDIPDCSSARASSVPCPCADPRGRCPLRPILRSARSS